MLDALVKSDYTPIVTAHPEEVTVIFLSAYGQEQLVARALDMGTADYLDEDFSPVELPARIRAACAGRRCRSRQRSMSRST